MLQHCNEYDDESFHFNLLRCALRFEVVNERYFTRRKMAPRTGSIGRNCAEIASLSISVAKDD
jgi:hypothetical protein